MSTKSKESVKVKCPEAYGAEVVKCITQMRDQHLRLTTEIGNLEGDKRRLQTDIRNLTDRLAKVNHNLAIKTQFRTQLSKTIQETEHAYSKLVESSEVLYKSVKETKTQILAGTPSSTAELQAPSMSSESRRPGTFGSTLDPVTEGRTVAAAVASELSNKRGYGA